MTKKIRRNTRGETLAESLIALSILAVGITLSGMVVAASLTNVQGSKERILAINLAREAVEGMRNIRDTNWLKFSSSRRICWNHLPLPLSDPNESACTVDTNKIEPGEYLIYTDKDNQWRLEAYNPAADSRFLSVVDIDDAIDSDGDGTNDNDPDFFNHPLEDALGEDHATPSPFIRWIKIGYLTNDGDEGDSADNRMTVEATVQWTDRRLQAVTLSTLITDYLGRENLTD